MKIESTKCKLLVEKIKVIRNYYWAVELKTIRRNYQCIRNKRMTKSSIDFGLSEKDRTDPMAANQSLKNSITIKMQWG